MIEMYEIERFMRLQAERNRTKSFKPVLVLIQLSTYGYDWIDVSSIASDINSREIRKDEIDQLSSFNFIEVRSGLYGTPKRKSRQIRLCPDICLAKSEFSKHESRLFGNAIYQLLIHSNKGGVLMAQALFAVFVKQVRFTSDMRSYLLTSDKQKIKDYARYLEEANLAQVMRMNEDVRKSGSALFPIIPTEVLFNEE